MRMRRGFTDFSANKLVHLTPKPSATPTPAESLMKWRRVGFMFWRYSSVIPSDMPVRLGPTNLLLSFGGNERCLDSARHDKGKMDPITRREAARLIAASAAGLFLPSGAARAANESSRMLMRAIPSSGEKLPVIGLGTWRTFDVDLAPDNRKELEDVLSLFVKLGGRVIDSSPMYGRAEQVIGDLTAALGIREQLFLTTKLWTHGKDRGIESMERSMARLRTKRIDLLQVHNLVAVHTHLSTLREWQEQGPLRY